MSLPVLFLGDVHSIEAKERGTGDLAMNLSCRNALGPIAMAVHFTGGNGEPVRSPYPQYNDAAGRFTIRESVACQDRDAAVPTVLHIPASFVPDGDRKLRTQVDFFGPDDHILDRSKEIDIHFPKPSRSNPPASVYVEPSSGGMSAPVLMTAVAVSPQTAPNAKSTAPVAISEPAVSALAGTSRIESSSDGIASVTSDPGNAEIYVDSEGMGKTPQLLHLKAGQHTIQLVMKGYKDWTSRLDVKVSSIVNVTARLEK